MRSQNSRRFHDQAQGDGDSLNFQETPAYHSACSYSKDSRVAAWGHLSHFPVPKPLLSKSLMTSEHGPGVAMATDATGTFVRVQYTKVSVRPCLRLHVRWSTGVTCGGANSHIWQTWRVADSSSSCTFSSRHTTDEWFITLWHFPFIITHKGVLPSQIARSHDAILSSCISFITERVGYPEVVTSPILLNNDGPGDSGMFPPPELCRMFAQIVAQAAVLL